MLLGSCPTLWVCPVGSFLPQEQRPPSKQPPPQQAGRGQGSRAPEESHSDTSIPGVPAGTAMTQMRHSSRDGTRGPHRRLVRSQLICAPDTLSLNADSSDANRQTFRLKVSSSKMTHQQTLQDSTQMGALESTTHGPKWTAVLWLQEGVGSETFMVVEFWFYKMKSSREGGDGSTTR